MVTPKAKRAALAHLKEAHRMSERRACRLLGAPRSSMRYRSRPRDNEAVLTPDLRALADSLAVEIVAGRLRVPRE